MSGLRTLGVTGGIGSGKTTVCAYLKCLGAIIFEADLVARKLMESSERVRTEIVQTFGSASYESEGSLNRPWLAAQVFNDGMSLDRLNAIVHPRVAESFETLRRRLQGVLLVHEAALIYEAKLEDRLDAICVVSAPEDVRISRVKARDSISTQEVHARMQRQLPPDESERRADIILMNEGDLAQLRLKTQKLHDVAMGAEVLNGETFKSIRRL